MVAPSLPWKGMYQQSAINDHACSILLLDDFLQIPALLGADEERNAEEMQNMIGRSFAIRDFIDGRLSPDCLEMALYEFGLDPYQVSALWERGVTLK